MEERLWALRSFAEEKGLEVVAEYVGVDEGSRDGYPGSG